MGNWGARSGAGSNRTFMELKQSNPPRRSRKVISSNRTFMELKQKTQIFLGQILKSSNRTFMELKHENAIEQITFVRVLIVPLWN